MITEELFTEYINLYQDYIGAIDRVSGALCGNKYCAGFYESDWNIGVNKMADVFLRSHFNDEAIDWIYWWLFEDVDKIIYEKDGNETNVEDIHDLWNYICKING